MLLTIMTTLPFLLLALSPFLMSDSDYLLISCRLCKSKTFWNIFMKLGRNVEKDKDDVSYTRMTTLPFLLLALSPFVILDKDYPLILFLLCKSKTLWHIFMILGRNLEQTRQRVVYKNDNSAFLTFGIITLCYIWHWLSIDFVYTM